MFIIIGGDGKEYGPVTVDQVRTWINAGRANLDTKAKALGSEEWRRLGDYAEFSATTDVPPMVRSSPVMGSTVGSTVVTDNATGLVRAERGTRLLARVIDWALEFACAIPGGMILGPEFFKIFLTLVQGQEPDLEQIDIQRLILGGVVLGAAQLVLLIVQVWMLSTRGQSIGKRITRIRIVRHDDGSKPGFVYGWLLRELVVTAIGTLIGMLPIVGIFLLRPAFHLVDWCFIFREDQRCLHDLMAGTRVVRA